MADHSFPSVQSAEWWEPVGKNGWTCLACRDKKVHSKDNARRHEKTAKHVHSVQHHCANLQGAFNAEGSGSGGREGFPSTHVQSMHGIGLILEEMSTVVGEYSHTDDDGSIPYTADSSETNIQFQESFVEKTREQIAVTLSNLLDEDGLSDDEETGEINVESEFGMEDTFAEVAGEENAGMKSVDAPGENEWFPWPNKLSCTIDILMHLPRSVFSQHQVDLLTWILHINGVQNVPSVRTLKTLEDGLQKICGIETLPFTGALGHKYYMNSLADIIRQEMANPHVRSQLHFYPEDTGKQLNEAFQARRWLKEMDPTQLTPMI